MKRVGRIWVILSLGVLLASHSAIAQFSNEWINFSQTYYKIPVVKSGIYRISYTDLQNAGLPVGAVDPRRINIFHRGTEQAIFVQGQADAQLDPTDFIEFYGQRNDGTLDADLYTTPNLQPHPYYNLFSDTTAYFLTWNPLPVLGKRMAAVSEVNGSGILPETFQTAEQRRIYFDEYAGGLTQQQEIQSTAFDQGEGWTGPVICTGLSGCTGQQDFVIDNLLRGVSSAGSPSLEVLLVARDALAHQIEIGVGADGGSVHAISTQPLNPFESKQVSLTMNWTDIGSDGRTTVRVRIIGGSTAEQISVSYVKVNFPQDYDLTGASEKVMELPPNATDKSYLEMLNAPAGLRVWDITDPSSLRTIATVPVTGAVSATLSGTSNGRTLYVSNVTQSASLKKVTFRSFVPSAHNYIIISHRSLMKPALGYNNVVEAYASYRASVAGGSYDTLTVAMDQLYDQFNYGETSPRAIYQFMKFLVNGGNPEHLFLMGKGMEVSLGYYRKTVFNPGDFRDLVPSAGMPGSDMAFTAGLNGTTFEPAVPTGRLTATTPAQVAGYLNKVIEAEVPDFTALWRKDLLHLSGGIHAGETDLFRSYVDGFKAIAEGNYLGGKVSTISKQTLNVELINVKDQVNHGLNLITFYGHSGPGTIDIDIGYVSDPTLGYNNKGKYPAFLINGCNAGRFYDNRLTFGEDWVLTPDKGAKAFIAHSFFGFTSSLKQYSDIFYAVAFADSVFLGKGIGEVQKETARQYLLQSGADLVSVTQVQQMVLLGDPAVRLFGAAKVDYETNDNEVTISSLDGKPVTAASQSFAVNVHVRNFGRTNPAPMKIRVQRTLSDNSVVNYDSTFAQVLYEETLQFKIKKGRTDAESGTSRFVVTIDPDQAISELNETNNTGTLTFFIPRNGTQNLYPMPFGIVSTNSISLLFQNSNLLADTRTFKIEIDTAASFDSPFLNRQTLTGKVLMKVPLTLLAKDSLVYYWRTKFDVPQGDESTEWTSSSFTYIQQGPSGWAQIQFPQIKQGIPDGLVPDDVFRRFNFKETVTPVDVTTFGSTNPTPFTQVSLKINGEEFNVSSQGAPCRNNTLNLIAFDKNSTAPYAGIPFGFSDPRSCGKEPQMINNFLLSEMDLTDGISEWVANLNPSDSVVLFSIGDPGIASWSSVTRFALSQLGLGSSQLSGISPGEPFVVFGKKGTSSGSALVVRPSSSPPEAQSLTVNKTITGRYSQGTLTSAIVGPAQRWTSIKVQTTEVTGNDTFSVTLSGIDAQGQTTVLKNVTSGNTDISDIDSLTYPYLQLTWNTADNIDLTPAQLKKWIVTYHTPPEGMLIFEGSTASASVLEGDTWSTTGYGFVNISDKPFKDSLTVQLNVYSSEQNSTATSNIKIKPPVPGDTTSFAFKVPTTGKAGANDVTVFVNPQIEAEQYYENNQLTFYDQLVVEADRTAPVLDVTVDGRNLINGDVVSPSPTVMVRVIDQNPFLMKTDTTGINLFLQLPCIDDCHYQRILFSQSDVVWTPATATTDFQMVYHPANLLPGEYVLRAEAVDASGNVSGDVPYEVNFVVGHETNFVLRSVYPNPTNDFFHFEVLIAGDEMPDGFQLDLFSARGEQVRSIGQEAISQLHIGTNTLSMPASDANGNDLANGLYLYRITTSIKGRQYLQSGRVIVTK